METVVVSASGFFLIRFFFFRATPIRVEFPVGFGECVGEFYSRNSHRISATRGEILLRMCKFPSSPQGRFANRFVGFELTVFEKH